MPDNVIGLGIVATGKSGKILVKTLAKVDDVLKGTGNFTTKEIRFTQDSISSTFKDGSSINYLIQGLKSGTISSDYIPAIRIFEKNGIIYSLDNRRLYAFKEAGIENIKTVWATIEEIALKHGNLQQPIVVVQLELEESR